MSLIASAPESGTRLFAPLTFGERSPWRRPFDMSTQIDRSAGLGVFFI